MLPCCNLYLSPHTRALTHTTLTDDTHTHKHITLIDNTQAQKRHPLGYARTFCLFRRVGITITQE